MLLSHRFQGKNLELCPGYKKSSKNQFTAIVGKNGAGKSRLLNELVKKAFTSSVEPNNPDSLPIEIIALSTSPFDKFILPDSKDFLVAYHYMGLRGLYSNNLSLSFMTRIIGGLFKSLHNSTQRLKIILNTLSYLEYHQNLEVHLTIQPKLSGLKNPQELIDYFFMYGTWLSIGKSRSSNYQKIRDDLLKSEEIPGIIEAIEYLCTLSPRKQFSATISADGVKDPNGNILDTGKISTLIEIDLIKLNEISLHKIGVNNPYHVKDASSGEQCVLMAVLGIASRISNGALICIDEPEICLHPEWQERYIKNLMEAFEDFTECQFLIATHSPQIISRLNDQNCYVLDLQTGKSFASTEFNKRSADYQLATLFKTPGLRNEYLLREAVSVLGAMSSELELSKDKIQIAKILISLKEKFTQGDPVLDLIILIEEGLEALGRG